MTSSTLVTWPRQPSAASHAPTKHFLPKPTFLSFAATHFHSAAALGTAEHLHNVRLLSWSLLDYFYPSNHSAFLIYPFYLILIEYKVWYCFFVCFFSLNINYDLPYVPVASLRPPATSLDPLHAWNKDPVHNEGAAHTLKPRPCSFHFLPAHPPFPCSPQLSSTRRTQSPPFLCLWHPHLPVARPMTLIPLSIAGCQCVTCRPLRTFVYCHLITPIIYTFASWHLLQLA